MVLIDSAEDALEQIHIHYKCAWPLGSKRIGGTCFSKPPVSRAQVPNGPARHTTRARTHAHRHRHTQARTHAHTHTRTHTDTHARTHAHTAIRKQHIATMSVKRLP